MIKPSTALIVLGIFYAGGVGTGYLVWHKPPQPAITLKQDDHKKEDKQEAKTSETNKGAETIVKEKFARRCPVDISRPIGCPGCDQEVLERTTIHRGPSDTKTSSSIQSQTIADSHLDLTIKPQKSSLQVQVGFEGILEERKVRGAARFRLGQTPLWLEVSHVPSNGLLKGLGGAVALEF